MKTIVKWSLCAASRFPRLLSCALILVLPFGYYTDYPDSSQFEIGFGGGFGQAASIMRDCSGGVVSKHSVSFKDVGGNASVRFRLKGDTYNVLTMRSGYLWSELGSSEYAWQESNARPDLSYFGATIGVEGKNVGFGIGFIRGRIPTKFDDEAQWDSVGTVPSFHLRLGNARKVHFIGSWAENLPLVSGGGYLNLGVGYPVAGTMRMFTGTSFLPYDGFGFVQQAQIRLNRQWALDINGRFGDSEGIFEGAISTALVFRFGKN